MTNPPATSTAGARAATVVGSGHAPLRDGCRLGRVVAAADGEVSPQLRSFPYYRIRGMTKPWLSLVQR
jgi:hypothetical protein